MCVYVCVHVLRYGTLAVPDIYLIKKPYEIVFLSQICLARYSTKDLVK